MVDLRCAPDWVYHVDSCPFGEVWFGDISRPYVWVEGYPGLSFFGVCLNFIYSVMPWVGISFAVLAMFYAILRPGGSSTFTWSRGDVLGEKELWRLRWLQQITKFFIFGLIVFIVKFLITLLVAGPALLADKEQRWFFFSPKRPARSCVKSCGMPSGQALWAVGILAYLVIENCMGMVMPHLIKKRVNPTSKWVKEQMRKRDAVGSGTDTGRQRTQTVPPSAGSMGIPLMPMTTTNDRASPETEGELPEEASGTDTLRQRSSPPSAGSMGIPLMSMTSTNDDDEGELPDDAFYGAKYEEKEMMLMGVFPVSTSSFIKRILAAFLLLGPVPSARMNLQDSSFEQVAVGGILGLVLSCAFHYCWVMFFLNERFAGKIRHCLVVFAMKVSLICRCCMSSRTTGQDNGLPSTKRLPDIDLDLVETRSSLQGDGLWANVRGFEFMGISTESEVFLHGMVADIEKGVRNQLREKRKKLEEEMVDLEKRKKELQKDLVGTQKQFKEVSDIPKQLLQEENNGRIEDLEGAIVSANAVLMRLYKEAKDSKSTELQNSFANLKKLITPAVEKARVKADSWKNLLTNFKKAIDIWNTRYDASDDDKKQYRKNLHQQTEKVYDIFTECIREGLSLWKKWEQVKIDGIDYNKLASDPQLTESFKTEIKKVVVKETGNNIEESSVDVVLSSGSVVATIKTDEPTTDKLKSSQTLTKSIKDSIEQMQRVQAVKKGTIDVNKVASKAERLDFILEKWQTIAMKMEGNDALCDVIRKKAAMKDVSYENKDEYGKFSFTDLDRCLRIVRRLEKNKNLNACKQEIERRTVHEMRSYLEVFKDLVKFLDFLKMETIAATTEKFLSKNEEQSSGDDPDGLAKQLVNKVCTEKIPEFVTKDMLDLAITEPEQTLQQLKGKQPGKLGELHNIFVALAEAKKKQYGVLVAPHLPQLAVLLMFKDFIKDTQWNSLKTMIAEVATGEGKSMLIACFAAFVVKSESKKVHVVGCDERLVSRDFKEYQPLFAKLGIKAKMLRMTDKVTQDDQPGEDTWDQHIIYCLPHHIALLYNKEARRQEKASFSKYEKCVLLLDEVDSLVVDGDPNEPILYDSWTRPPGQNQTTSSQIATDIATEFGNADVLALAGHERPNLKDYKSDPGRERIFKQVQKYWNASNDSNFASTLSDTYQKPEKNPLLDEYVKLDKDGKPNELLKDNQREVLNFRYKMWKQRKTPEKQMTWYERGFIVSKPGCFTKYFRILGFTGTTGNKEEEDFIRKAYNAQILRVPAFLDCCGEGKGKSVAKWTCDPEIKRAKGNENDFKIELEVNENFEYTSMFIVGDEGESTQIDHVVRVAMTASEHVPVLIIARDPTQAEAVVDRCQIEAGNKFKEYSCDDLVQNLAQGLFKRSERLYRDRLTRATERAGPDPEDRFRVTVTDKSGGRGTDYKMEDGPANEDGGLLVVMMYIPPEKREWVQYRGRTARQDRNGQIVSVLLNSDYPELDLLGRVRRKSEANPEEVVKKILDKGEEKSKQTMIDVKTDFAAGMHMNDLCEIFWTELQQTTAKQNEDFLLLLQTFRYKTIETLNKEMQTILKNNEEHKVIELRDKRKWKYTSDQTGDCKFTNVPRDYQEYTPPECKQPPKSKDFIFCLDISGSMGNTDGGTKSRLETCKESLERILQEFTDKATDSRTIYAFDNDPIIVIKDGEQKSLESQLKELAPRYGTDMKGAMFRALTDLTEQRRDQVVPCFIVLTDGLDQHQTKTANEINDLLDKIASPPFIFGCFTIGPVGTSASDMQTWIGTVNRKGGGQNTTFMLPAGNDANDIKKKFEEMGDYLVLEEGGIAGD